MPGFEIYESGNTKNVYVADKEDETSTDHVKEAYLEFKNYSHTERQLVIEAIKDLKKGSFISSGDKIDGREKVSGDLYVYTFAKPCFD